MIGNKAFSSCDLDSVSLNGFCYSKQEVFQLKTINVTDGYVPIGRVNKYQCPSGTFAYSSGLTYPWQCRLCPPGMICPQGIPEKFQVRTTTDPGASDSTDVRACPSGFICQPGRFPDVCPLGSYLEAIQPNDIELSYLDEYDSRNRN